MNSENQESQLKKNLSAFFQIINSALTLYGFSRFVDNFLKTRPSSKLEDDVDTNESTPVIANTAENALTETETETALLDELEKVSQIPEWVTRVFRSDLSAKKRGRLLRAIRARERKKRMDAAGGVYIATDDERNQVKWFLDQEQSNPYFQHLINCIEKRTEHHTAGVFSLHEHHILPKPFFKPILEPFYELPFNIIMLTPLEHIRAHELLYDLYQDMLDVCAIHLLRGNMSEALRIWRQAGGHATQRLLRARGSEFYDRDYQREMARRSMARPDALEIRSAGGKVGGRNTQIGRAIKKEDRYVF